MGRLVAKSDSDWGGAVVARVGVRLQLLRTQAMETQQRGRAEQWRSRGASLQPRVYKTRQRARTATRCTT